MQVVTPERLFDLAMGFWPAKTLLSAVELDVFTALHQTRLTGAQLQETLALSSRANPDFFDSLVALGLLKREGSGKQACYCNSAESEAFLSRRSEVNLVPFFELASARLYRNWAGLTEALRSGRRQNEISEEEEEVFSGLYARPEGANGFTSAMSVVSRPAVRIFAERFNFRPFRKLLDVGGGNAMLGITIAEQHNHLHVLSIDLPQVTPLAVVRIKSHGLGQRVRAEALDFLAEALPSADLVTMNMVLHDWNLEKKMMLLDKAYRALPKNGALAVIETMIDNRRKDNAFGLLMSLNMLVEFGDGFDFTYRDFALWCKKVGLRKTSSGR